jgi:hypothetical protein
MRRSEGRVDAGGDTAGRLIGTAEEEGDVDGFGRPGLDRPGVPHAVERLRRPLVAAGHGQDRRARLPRLPGDDEGPVGLRAGRDDPRFPGNVGHGTAAAAGPVHHRPDRLRLPLGFEKVLLRRLRVAVRAEDADLGLHVGLELTQQVVRLWGWKGGPLEPGHPGRDGRQRRKAEVVAAGGDRGCGRHVDGQQIELELLDRSWRRVLDDDPHGQ